MELNEIREKIDKIDNSIMKLLKERMDLMPDVAEYKKSNGFEIFDLAREDKIIKCKKELAREFGLNPEMIEDIFRKIMDEGKDIQKRQVSESQ